MINETRGFAASGEGCRRETPPSVSCTPHPPNPETLLGVLGPEASQIRQQIRSFQGT